MAVPMAQVACEDCGAELAPEVAYCGRCGARTKRAKGLVRLAVRVELLAIALVLVMIVAFSFIYLR